MSGPFHIYTDGSCLPNKRGAWAYLILKDDHIMSQGSGPARRTSSNRMEFMGAMMALKAVPEGSKVILWTDSRILLDAAQTKILLWKNNGWLRPKGQAVIDLDIVKELDQLMQTRQVEWRWVRGHSGHPHNEYCDELCRKARAL